jgi:MFS family permease
MSGINIMPHYKSCFGVAALGGTTGLIFSMFYAGALVGIESGYWLADHWGRKMPILVGSVVALCSAIIQASLHVEYLPLSSTVSDGSVVQQFRGARFILG